MPNPLIGSRPLNVGKRADDRPHATPPVMEAYEGDNNAYRGIEDHGVPSSRSLAVAIDDDYNEDSVSGIYVPEKPDPDPIAVRIVDLAKRELRRFNSYTEIIPAGGQARMIAGRNPARTKITFMATANWFIGNTESLSSFNSFLVAANGTRDMTTEDAVFACQAPDAVAPLLIYVLEEFTVRE